MVLIWMRIEYWSFERRERTMKGLKGCDTVVDVRGHIIEGKKGWICIPFNPKIPQLGPPDRPASSVFRSEGTARAGKTLDYERETSY